MHRQRKPTLTDLCRAYGVQIRYRDVFGRLRRPPLASLLKVLKALGARLDTLSDLENAYRYRLAQLESRLIEPVVVLFDGARSLPVKSNVDSCKRVECRLLLEGERRVKSWFAELKENRTLNLPFRIPFGYHRFEIAVEGLLSKALIISAPSKAYQLKSKIWGVYIPLYALYSKRSWGAGTYNDLLTLSRWVSKFGAGFVGTTPLLPLNPNHTFDPSPYTPFSKVFWSEFYVDLNTPSNLRKLSHTLKQRIKEVNASKKVDYENIIKIKELVAANLAEEAIENGDHTIKRYIKEHPELEEYARFRASKQASSNKEYEARFKQHLYLQTLAQLQLKHLASQTKKHGVKLYLDLPLGCSPDGYDAWRWSNIFVKDVYVGAPPDSFFPKGQNWGINPIHPEKIREEGYDYFIQCIQHHMRFAQILRLDHVMALHRLYWIPKGAGGDEGVYVEYNAEEFYAIISLESHRHRCAVIGENLGTVPNYINNAIQRHGLIGCFILQIKPLAALQNVSTNTLTALNTHDMPPFKAYLEGRDIKLRFKMGLIDKEQAENEITQRTHQIEELRQHLKTAKLLKKSQSEKDLLEAALKLLALSKAKILLVNLEDLWLEEEAHNIPGTGVEAGNWRKRAKFSIEQFTNDKDIAKLLNLLSEYRKDND
ncbi:MAG: 4-alpha-glucanotransferase [Nitrososphaerales archaeon]